MKKCRALRIIIICFVCLTSCDSCKDDEEPTKLPAETQTGADTFGAYVNNKLFVNAKGPLFIWVRAHYDKKSNILSIGANANKASTIDIEVKNPKGGVKVKIEYASFRPEKGIDSYCSYLTDFCEGEVYLTRFDTINRIVSGTFFFDVSCSEPNSTTPSSSVHTTFHITNGRFDLRFIPYNN